MKKLISILLAITMIFSIAMISSYASTTSDEWPDINWPTDDWSKDCLYKDRFVEKYGFPRGAEYYERYYHHTDANDLKSPVDWVLVWAYSKDLGQYDCHVTYGSIGDRVLVTYVEYFPFDCRYGVYDVTKDEFVSLYDVDVDAYDGLQELIDGSFYRCKQLGDANLDGNLNIMDATTIQRGLAQLSPFNEDDRIYTDHDVCVSTPKFNYYSDIDCDGKRSVLDAAMIQRKLAFIEEE